MKIPRRAFLQFLGVSGAVATGVRPAMAAQPVPHDASPEDFGMLFDATKCIGCKNCVHACADANGLNRQSSSGLWQDPQDLDWSTKNIIQEFRADDRQSFMKRQCMHCVDPACMSACMIQALHKTDKGVVVYDADRCIGCRYCQVACPFNVPQFEWESTAPLVVKCELCNHRISDGRGPACCEVCPTHAVIWGERGTLLADAKKRIADNPELYEDHIYGEHEAGGTQVMYLTKKGVSFQELGLPKLSTEPQSGMSRRVQHAIYQGFIAPVVVYVALLAAVFRGRNRGAKSEGGEP